MMITGDSMNEVSNSILENKVEIDMKIKERLEKILKTIKDSLRSFKNQYLISENEKLVLSIKEKLLSIANILYSLRDFKDEFFEFLKIKSMLYYILENYDSIDLNHSRKIFESFYKFSDLIRFKINVLEKDGPFDEYEKEYQSFNSYLRNLKTFFFHLNIYQNTGKYDDAIIETAKVLLDY